MRGHHTCKKGDEDTRTKKVNLLGSCNKLRMENGRALFVERLCMPCWTEPCESDNKKIKNGGRDKGVTMIQTWMYVFRQGGYTAQDVKHANRNLLQQKIFIWIPKSSRVPSVRHWGNLGQCRVKPLKPYSAASYPGNAWKYHPLRWLFVNVTLKEVPTSRIGTPLTFCVLYVLAQSTAQHTSQRIHISHNSYSYTHSKSSAHIPCEASAQVKNSKTTQGETYWKSISILLSPPT